MCCKEEQHRILRQAKMKAYWKACDARKKSYLRQKRSGGRRILRKKTAGRNVGVNAASTMWRKLIAVNSNWDGNSAELCSEVGRSFEPMKDVSPLVVKEENLASETKFESLPLDILVRIVCNVHHDELKPLSHVSCKFRDAVLIARQMHFDYTTPIRLRAPKRRANCLIPNESSENCSRFEDLECFFSSSKRPATPNAPKQVGKFQKSRISPKDMKEIATLLFSPGTPVKDNDPFIINNQNQFSRSGGATNRVLFVEDELCEAVARNRL